jgi:hypothetical protein
MTVSLPEDDAGLDEPLDAAERLADVREDPSDVTAGPGDSSGGGKTGSFAPHGQLEAAAKAAQLLGFELQDANTEQVIFRRPLEEPGGIARYASVPLAYLSILVEELKLAALQHPSFYGFLIPSVGYSEVVLGTPPRTNPFLLERVLVRYAESGADSTDGQGAKEFPSVEFRRATRASPHEQVYINPVVRVRDEASAIVLEISNASPLGLLYFGRYINPAVGRVRDTPLIPTIKLRFGKAMPDGEIIAATERLVRSLIYELDIRNGVVVATQPRRRARGVRLQSLTRDNPTTVRFPRTRLQAEVADLFNFAAQANDNMLLSFLNYYQVLEYFLPAAVSKAAVARIRRELRDPQFDDNSDDSVIRILTEAERSTSISEASQVRVLLAEYVRKDKLEAFFASDWGTYFSKRGPIIGVQNISVESAEFVDHVSDRIYQIRNRIVHAKDNPKYRSSKVLLPLGDEAQALGPDVQLVRLVASEAILASQ